MLRTLNIEASPAAEPEAIGVLRSDGTARPTGFLRPNSRWSRLLRTQSDHRLWETVLFRLRDAFRAGVNPLFEGTCGTRRVLEQFGNRR